MLYPYGSWFRSFFCNQRMFSWLTSCFHFPPLTTDLFINVENQLALVDCLFVKGYADGTAGHLITRSTSETENVVVGNCHAETVRLEEIIVSLERFSETAPLNYLVTVLHKCRKEKNPFCARRLIEYIRNRGLEEDARVGNHLVPMLVDCGSISEAQQVFNRLMHRSENSRASLIQGCVEHGKFECALEIYQRMKDGNMHPSRHTLQLILTASGRLKNVNKVQEIHAEIIKETFEGNRFVASTLVDMYVKCGLLIEAQEVFEELPTHDTVSWTVLIAGYVEHGFYEKGLQCLEKMQMEGMFPDAVTFVCGIKACNSVGAVHKGRSIHLEIVKVGLERETYIGSVLIDMYAKHGSLQEGKKVFDGLIFRDVVLWNVLIAAYAEHDEGDKARLCLEKMREEGLSPNELTFVSSLKSYDGSRENIDSAQEICLEISKEGYEREPLIGGALVDLYAKFGFLAEAQKIFDRLLTRNVISWTALISGYVEHGFGSEALIRLEEMQSDGVAPNDVTYVCSLKACGMIGAFDRGRQIHVDIVVEGFECDVFVGNTLVDMYARCGSLREAQEVFDELQKRDVVSWNALSSRYAEQGFDEGVLQCMEQMQLEGVSPDVLTFLCSLKACSSLGATDTGLKLHAELSVEGFEEDSFVRGILVDMYAKCGSLAEALDVFDDMSDQDIVVWNALLAGYACQGQNQKVFSLFERMKSQGVHPNGITFLSILTVCSHAGLVIKGLIYFEVMCKEYAIPLTIEHYNCMVDLLGRAGWLEEAVAILFDMPFQPNLVTWSTLLGACRKWGDIELARQAFESAYKSDERYYALFISMSRIYAGAHMWEDAKMIEAMRHTMGSGDPAATLNVLTKEWEWLGTEENCDNELLECCSF